MKWKFSFMEQRIRNVFLKLYPFLHLAHEGALLSYQWAYLFGRSIYCSPTLHALGIIVRRITLEDLRKQESNRTLPTSSSSSNPTAVTRQTRSIALGSVAVLFIVRWIFTLRKEIGSQWRALATESDKSSGASGDQGNVSIPAPLPPPLVSGRQLPADINSCPLCNQIRVNPSASPSGYVFCYRCLFLHVREHGCCPLTNVACSESQIVRLYDSSRHS